jgi:hypothetical protein
LGCPVRICRNQAFAHLDKRGARGMLDLVLTFTELAGMSSSLPIALLFWQWRGQDGERHDQRRLLLPARATLGGIPLPHTAVL